MAKWKVGDIVRHRATREHVMILHVRCEDECLANNHIPQQYVVRLPNYTKTELSEFELEMVPISTKIQDARD